MSTSNTQDSIHNVARQAIDEETLGQVLTIATGEECDQAAVIALREIAVDEIVLDAIAAAARARRRGRHCPTEDDVGDAADERRQCCPGGFRTAQTLSASVGEDHTIWEDGYPDLQPE